MSLSISVVTPSFNSGEFLESTIQSVISQDYRDLEYIVVDGGSTDSSVSIIERYAAELSCTICEPDNGHTDALIKGFARSTGDIMATLNADDMYEPGTLREVASFFELHPDVQFVYGDMLVTNREGQVIKARRELPFSKFVLLHTYNYIPQPSAFWRRSLFEQVGGLDPSFKVAMDADLWMRFSEVTRPRHVARYWSRYRMHSKQTHQLLRHDCLAEELRIRRRYVSRWQGPLWTAKRLLASAVRLTWKGAINSYAR